MKGTDVTQVQMDEARRFLQKQCVRPNTFPRDDQEIRTNFGDFVRALACMERFGLRERSRAGRWTIQAKLWFA